MTLPYECLLTQTTGHIKRFTKTLVQRPLRYVDAHERDWNVYLKLLTNLYSLQARPFNKMTLFNLVLTRHPSRLVLTGVTSQERDTVAEEDVGPVQCKRATLFRLRNVQAHARSELSAAQRLYKSDFRGMVSFRLVVRAGVLFMWTDRHER